MAAFYVMYFLIRVSGVIKENVIEVYQKKLMAFLSDSNLLI